jgi:hypothetical protein
MQQRRLRLGDILDDYCPRERRITNHAVVAMIEDEIKQTRCTTCETEHEYKQARVPTLRRKKDSVAKAYKEVLAGVTADATMLAAQAAAAVEPEKENASPLPEPVAGIQPSLLDQAEVSDTAPLEAVEEPVAAVAPSADESDSDSDSGEQVDDQGRVHRRLIRATLPRTDNQPAARPIPQFTMRQPQGRPGKFRAGGGRAPVTARAAASGRNGGHPASSARVPGFRAGSTRGPAVRADGHRQARGGQQARHGKKYSK